FHGSHHRAEQKPACTISRKRADCAPTRRPGAAVNLPQVKGGASDERDDRPSPPAGGQPGLIGTVSGRRDPLPPTYLETARVPIRDRQSACPALADHSFVHRP